MAETLSEVLAFCCSSRLLLCCVTESDCVEVADSAAFTRLNIYWNTKSRLLVLLCYLAFLLGLPVFGTEAPNAELAFDAIN